VPIGPMDFQPIMPKVNEIARTQNELQQRVLSGEQQQAESAVKQAEQDTKTVHSQDEANKAIITEKERERKRQNARQGKDSEDGKEKAEDKKEKDGLLPQERHTIDIRL
jgi:hypothetical protein